MNHPIIFLDQDSKTKLVPDSFSCFLELICEKNKFYLKIVIVIKKKLIKSVFLDFFCKKVFKKSK